MEEVQIPIPADDEGFIGMHCRMCGQRFKLRARDLADDSLGDELYCPLCGLRAERGQFRSPKVDEIAETHARNLVADLLNDFGKEMERTFRGSKHMTFKRGRRLKKQPVPEIHKVNDLAIVEFACCDVAAKVPSSDALGRTYCPSCGAEEL